MVASWTFVAALVSMANADLFVFEAQYATTDSSCTGDVVKEVTFDLSCHQSGANYAMYSCSGTEADFSSYSDASCSTAPTSSFSHYSNNCLGWGSSPMKYRCEERAVVASMNYYSAAGCAESDKSSSMSMPGGCKATGSASSEKYEASGNELTHTTYSSNDCTGTAVTTTAIPCGGGTCTADGSVWMKIVLDCPTTMTTTATATATATATTTATATAMATSTATAMATATATTTTTGGATATTAAASVDSGSSLLRMELPLLLFLIRLLI